MVFVTILSPEGQIAAGDDHLLPRYDHAGACFADHGDAGFGTVA